MPRSGQSWPASRPIPPAPLSTDQERLDRLQEALVSAEKGVELAPDDSTVSAIHGFVLDWNASSNLISADEQRGLPGPG